MTLLTSKVTWVIVGMFVIGGLQATGVLNSTIATTLLGLLGAGGLVSHTAQIKAGKAR